MENNFNLASQPQTSAPQESQTTSQYIVDPQNHNNVVLNSLLYITNPFADDFEASWNGNKYLIQAGKMTPVVVSTPIENQNIRKLWALALCKRELQNDPRFKKIMPTDYDLEPLMQKCLSPLEKAEPIMRVAQKTPQQMAEQAKIEAVFELPGRAEGTINAGKIIQ